MRPLSYSLELLLECKNIHLSKSYNDLDPDGQRIEDLVDILQYREGKFGVTTSSITIDRAA